MKKRPIRAEGCRRAVTLDQVARAFAERMHRTGGFGCGDQDGGSVGPLDARAGTGQRLAEGGAQTAQTFQPWMAVGPQRRRAAGDPGGKIVRHREARGILAIGQAQQGGARFIRENQAGAIACKQPRRTRAARMHCDGTVAQDIVGLPVHFV